MKPLKARSDSECWLLLLALLMTPPIQAAAGASVMGQTFPIAEPDTLQEIKQAAGSRDWRSLLERRPADYSAFMATSLPFAKKDGSRMFDPTYSLPFDLRDDKGRVLYPKGTKVNVYDKLKMRGRYIVIAPRKTHYEWLDQVAKPSSADKVLVANGNVLLARQATGRALFLLDERFVERFGLQSVPAIVQQEGNRLRVNEYALPE